MSYATATKFRVIRPGAGIVSTHRKLTAAFRSLDRQRRGSRAQDCQDYIQVRLRDGEWEGIRY